MLPVVLEALVLEVEILARIPPTALKTRPPPRQGQESATDEDIIVFARSFYGIKSSDTGSLISRSAAPFVTAFEDLIALSTTAANALLTEKGDVTNNGLSRNILLMTLSLLDTLVSRLEHESDASFVANWDPAEWLSTVLACIQQKVRIPRRRW